MFKAYKYRMYPTAEQAELIQKTFGCRRFIWNQMLAERIAIYEKYKDDEKKLKKQKRKYKTPAKYKPDYEWLGEVDSSALSNVQMDLNIAYEKFSKEPNIGYPRFKSN